jgi:cellulase
MRLQVGSSVVCTAWLVQQAVAHGIVTKVVVAGTKTYSGYNPDFQYSDTPVPAVGWITPENQDNGFVLPDEYGSADIICHKNAKVANQAAAVNAGDEIALHWTTWPGSHHGPVMDYLAPVSGDFASLDKTSLKFFKINEVGMTDGSRVRVSSDEHEVDADFHREPKPLRQRHNDPKRQCLEGQNPFCP